MANFNASRRRIIDRVQVNIPFTWLIEDRWLDIFIENRINPEIGIDAAALDGYTLSDFADMARRFHEIGRKITIHGPFLDLPPGSPDPAVREIVGMRLEQTIAAADAFSPETVVCHAGYDPFRYEFVKESWFKMAADTWNRVGRRLNKSGCRLMLENVYETGPDQLLALFDLLDNRFIGCCLDIGHLNVFGNKPLPFWLEELTPHIGQLHLHDNKGGSDQHLGLGLGNIDTAPLADLFSPGKKPPVVTLEPHTREDLQVSIDRLSDMEWFR